MATSIYSPGRRVLHSWKEISSYTGRGVRTIQRYEVQFGFPIHRPAGSPRSAVLAFTDEIDHWLAETPTGLVPVAKANDRATHADRMHSVWTKAKLGCERAEAITKQLQATKALLDQLVECMQKGRTRRALFHSKFQFGRETYLKLAPPEDTATRRE